MAFLAGKPKLRSIILEPISLFILVDSEIMLDLCTASCTHALVVPLPSISIFHIFTDQQDWKIVALLATISEKKGQLQII